MNLNLHYKYGGNRHALHKFLLVMKLIVILITTAILQVSASTYAQKITLNKTNMPLEKVMKEIRQQSGYDFFYDLKLIKNTKPISINVKDASLEEVLDKCFANQPLTYKIGDKVVMIKEKDKSFFENTTDRFQTIDVSGRVVDNEGKPLPGANIKVKGTNIMASANENGEFTLKNVDEKAVLEISFVGYKNIEINVSKDYIIIKMQIETSQLSAVEVVSTGYQQLAKERATGSFTVIDGKKLNEVVGKTILEKLVYMTNGLTKVSNDVSGISGFGLTIRGISTATGSISKPLIVLDNFEYNGDLNSLNPNDVENITILKDAAAGSIWGAKAGNGVIVITTKKGKYNQDLNVAFNVNTTVIDKPDLFSIKKMSTSDYIEVEKILFANEHRFADTVGLVTAYSPVYEILFNKQKGKITADEAESQINSLRNIDVRNDFDRYIYSKALNQQYSLSLNGGARNFSWNVFSGYDNNIDKLSAKDSRLNLNFGTNIKLSEKIELSTIINFTNSKSSSGKTDYNSLLKLPPYFRFADNNGNALPYYDFGRVDILNSLGNGKLLDWNYYPLNDYSHNVNKINNFNFNGSVRLKIAIIDGLDINFLYNAQKQNRKNSIYADVNSVEARRLINKFSIVDPTTLNVTYNIPRGGILKQAYDELSSENVRLQTNFNKAFAKNSITFLGGAEIKEVVSSSNGNTTFGYDDEFLTFKSVDYINFFPTYPEGAYDRIVDATYFDRFNNRFISFFGNFSYDYDSRYTASLSFRNDASNIFGIKTNQKFSPFYSAGFLWNLSNEQFYSFDEIPVIKLRITHGIQGNYDPAAVALLTTIYTGQVNPNTGRPIARINSFPNPNLRWEKVAITNIGLDFSNKNNRVSGSIEYFRKKTTDLLYQTNTIDPTTGVSNIRKNVGTLYGRGIDLQIKSLNINGQLKWTTELNFNHSVEKMGKVNLQGSSPYDRINNGVSQVEGDPFFALYAIKSAGLDPMSGEPRGILNGAITKNYDSLLNYASFDDVKFIGRATPSVYGSFGNTVSYKNFSLTARFTYEFGYYFRRLGLNYSDLYNGQLGHSDFALRWQKPGDEAFTKIPSFIYSNDGSSGLFYNSYSDELITRGDHIRLQYINLSYTFNNLLLKNLPIKNLNLYANIDNVGLIWMKNKQGIDPHNQNGKIPRSYSIGISSNF